MPNWYYLPCLAGNVFENLLEKWLGYHQKNPCEP
jgi:hypothetical protein